MFIKALFSNFVALGEKKANNYMYIVLLIITIIYIYFSNSRISSNL